MSESSQHDHQESVLFTEPSFCIYNTDDDKFGEVAENGEGKLERSATIGENIEAEFSFGKNEMRMIEEDEEEEEERASNRFKDLKIEIQGEYISPPIYPAKGAGGVEAEIGGGGGGEFGPSNSCDLDKYYKEMVVQDPSFSNPLVLRNYALYLEVGFFNFNSVLEFTTFVSRICMLVMLPVTECRGMHSFGTIVVE